MQKLNRKSQPTLPSTILPPVLKGLQKLVKVAFMQPEIEAAQSLQARIETLIKKPVLEHRMRLSTIEGATMKRALAIEKEYIEGGAMTAPASFAPVIAYLDAFAAGKPLPKLPKAVKPAVAVEAHVEVIEAGVEIETPNSVHEAVGA